jgi:hypothetical protein
MGGLAQTFEEFWLGSAECFSWVQYALGAAGADKQQSDD